VGYVSTFHPIPLIPAFFIGAAVAGNSRQFWIFQNCIFFDKPRYDYKSKFNMISKATLENAKGRSEKILLIADEGSCVRRGATLDVQS
jgi:hypothetical protein